MSSTPQPRLGPHPAPGRTAPTPDQTDRAIHSALVDEGGAYCPCDVLVIDDATGALTAQALEDKEDHPSAVVVSWASSRRRARQLAALFPEQIAAGRLVVPVGPEPMPLEEAAALADGHPVIGRLPNSLAALDAIARQVARAKADSEGEGCLLVLGARVKHMTASQNETLAVSFTDVHGARGVSKSRALVAEGPREGLEPPRVTEHAIEIGVGGAPRTLQLRGVGGVFGSAAADAGSLLLLDALGEYLAADGAAEGGSTGETADGGTGDPADGAGRARALRADAALDVIDLGCGNGLLTAWAAAAFPQAHLLASDDDADAVASTRATLAVNAVDPARFRVTWDDALSEEPDASADLVLLNPPFHDGTTIDPTLVQGLLDAAARVLRPGGQLWFVHNSHLRYRAEVERRVGPVDQRARDRRFTVLRAVRSAPAR